MSQAVESRNASSSKTQHPLCCGLTAHFPNFDVCQYWKLDCFLDSYYFLEISWLPSSVRKISGRSHNNLSNVTHRDLVCVTYGASKRDSNTRGNWREKPGSKVVEFELCFGKKLR